jgi:hypothetical protein
MKQIRLLIAALVLSTLLFSCSSKPIEEYVDYFYTYKSVEQVDKFTYILYLGEEGSHGLPDEKSTSAIPQRQKQSTKNSEQPKKRSSSGKVDDFMSISFRMEEEAFARLEKILEQKQFCGGEVKYEINEYTWLRYTIKGYCGS